MPGTKQPELSLERFSALVEAYGGELSRFPERERTAAKELLLSSREAQQLLAAASVFDSLLASAKLDLPSPELERELAQIPARFPQQRSNLRLLPFRTPARAGMAAAAAVLLGLLGGQLNPVDAPSPDSNDSARDLVDIAALTFADGLFDDLTTDQGDAE